MFNTLAPLKGMKLLVFSYKGALHLPVSFYEVRLEKRIWDFEDLKKIPLLTCETT